MSDFPLMIMSLDNLQISILCFLTLVLTLFVIYKFQKNQNNLGKVTDNINITEPININITEPITDNINITEPITDNINITEPITDNINKLILETSSIELLEGALVYDTYGSHEEAEQILSEIIQTEKNPKEKIRFNIIYKNYINSNEKLSDLIIKFPSLLTKSDETESNELNDNVEVSNVLTKSDETESNELTDTVEVSNVLTKSDETESNELTDTVEVSNALTKSDETESNELTKEDLIFQSILEDTISEEDQKNYNENFMKEFGELAQEIKQEKDNLSIDKEIHHVWVNYMTVNEGHINLKDIFVDIENAWGNVASIREIQEKITKEIEKDSDNKLIQLAIVSVLPLKK